MGDNAPWGRVVHKVNVMNPLELSDVLAYSKVLKRAMIWILHEL